MDITQLEAAAARAAEVRRELYRDVVAATTLGGRVTPGFSEKLAAAATVDEFIESVYEDDGLRQERAWAYIARRLACAACGGKW